MEVNVHLGRKFVACYVGHSFIDFSLEHALIRLELYVYGNTIDF